MHSCKPVQQGGSQIVCSDLCRKQQHTKLRTAQQALPYRQHHKGWPGTNTGRQQGIRFLRRKLTGPDCLRRCTGRWCKATQEPDAEHPCRTGCADADAPRRQAERQGQQVAFRALNEQARYHEKREQREQQRPAAEGQPFPQSSGTNLRHCKRQNPCRQCQQKQTRLIPSEKLIHTHALRFHIYVIRGAVLPGGEGAGVKQQKTGRLSLRGWFGRMLRQPPRGFYGQPSVYLSGGVMEIEHFRRVRTYEEGRLCLEFAGGLFTVYGDGLRIETLAAHRITLRGRFLRTDFSSS